MTFLNRSVKKSIGLRIVYRIRGRACTEGKVLGLGTDDQAEVKELGITVEVGWWE
jgi:hypothetical protein